MRKIILSLLATGTMIAVAPPALARDGCGPGGHRTPRGYCVPNRGAPVYVNRGPAVRLVIGNYYHGRGYWDGRRYWQNRERWRGGWRYR